MEKSKQYLAGYDAGYNTPNGENCHINHFSTPAKRDEWQRGNTQGKIDKLNKELAEKKK